MKRTSVFIMIASLIAFPAMLPPSPATAAVTPDCQDARANVPRSVAASGLDSGGTAGKIGFILNIYTSMGSVVQRIDATKGEHLNIVFSPKNCRTFFVTESYQLDNEPLCCPANSYVREFSYQSASYPAKSRYVEDYPHRLSFLLVKNSLVPRPNPFSLTAFEAAQFKRFLYEEAHYSSGE